MTATPPLPFPDESDRQWHRSEQSRLIGSVRSKEARVVKGDSCRWMIGASSEISHTCPLSAAMIGGTGVELTGDGRKSHRSCRSMGVGVRAFGRRGPPTVFAERDRRRDGIERWSVWGRRQ